METEFSETYQKKKTLKCCVDVIIRTRNSAPFKCLRSQNLLPPLWALGQLFSPQGFFYSDLCHHLSDVTGGRRNISEMGRQTSELKVKGQTEVFFFPFSKSQTKSINKLKGLQAVYNQI